MCVVSDETGSIIVTLFEGDVEKVEVGKSHNFNHLTLRSWNQARSFIANDGNVILVLLNTRLRSNKKTRNTNSTSWWPNKRQLYHVLDRSRNYKSRQTDECPSCKMQKKVKLAA